MAFNEVNAIEIISANMF